MNWRKNREEGGRDAFDDRPALTPQDAASAAYGMFAEVDKRRAVVVPVPVWDFEIRPEIQVRIGGLDEDTVRTYTTILLEGGQFSDPVVAFSATKEPPYILADGYHRLEAHNRAYAELQASPAEWVSIENPEQLLVVRCKVLYGDFSDAYNHAEDANLTHGLALSTRDRFNIFERRTTREHDWVFTSNNAIAQVIGVSHRTIQRWRERVLERNPDNIWAEKSVHGTERITAQGTTMRVGGLQEAREKTRAPEEIRKAKTVVYRLENLIEDFDELAYPEAADTLRGWLEDWKSQWDL